MKLGRSNSNQTIIITLIALSTLNMAMSATTPALADIAAAFPQEKQTTVALLATIPSLFSVPCSLITGRLLGRRLRYRTMAAAGVMLMIFGGLFPLFLNSLALIVCARAMMGIGLGILVPITPSATLLSLPREQAQRQMGVNAAAANAAAVAYQLIGGFACSISWRYSFLAYLLVIPVLPLVLFYMREPEIWQEPDQEQPQDSEKSSDPKQEPDQEPGSRTQTDGLRAFGKTYWGWFALNFIFIILFYAYITNISSIIADNNYGTASASALVLAVFSLGGTYGGHIMSRLISRLQKRVIVLAGLACFIGEITLAMGSNLGMMFLGSLVYGLGFGMMMPSIALFSGFAVRPEQRAFALSVNAIGNGVGTFLSAYIFAAIAGLFGVAWDRFSILLSALGALSIAATFSISEWIKTARAAKRDPA